MAKLAFVLLALVTIQGCFGASLQHPKLNDLEEAIEEFSESIKEVGEIISFIAGHLSSVARDYDYEIGQIVEKHPTYPIIEHLRETISNLESQSTDDSKSCFESAWTETVTVTEELKRGTDNCISDARAMGGHIKSILESIDGKATRLQSQLVDGFHKCKELEDQEAVKCLRDALTPLKEELTELKTEVDEAHEHVHKDVDDATRELNICMQHVKRDVTVASDFVVDVLERCIKGGSFAKFAPKGILDFFNELRETIEYIIHLVSHLPTSIEEIPDKINEIISHINISALYSQLKSEVHDIIAEGGRDAEKCRPEADEKLNAVVKAAEDTASICMASTEGKVEEVEAEFKALLVEAKQLLDDVNDQILSCFEESNLNPIAIVKCLESHGDGFKKQLATLQQKVVDTIESAKQQADDLLEDFASCLNKVQLETIKNGQSLIADVEKCVQNSHLLF